MCGWRCRLGSAANKLRIRRIFCMDKGTGKSSLQEAVESCHAIA